MIPAVDLDRPGDRELARAETSTFHLKTARDSCDCPAPLAVALVTPPDAIRLMVTVTK